MVINGTEEALATRSGGLVQELVPGASQRGRAGIVVGWLAFRHGVCWHPLIPFDIHFLIRRFSEVEVSEKVTPRVIK